MTAKSKNNQNSKYDKWACGEEQSAPVALHLRQILVPAEGSGEPIFPATYPLKKGSENYAGYNIDILDDGTKVASIDSVGSQANRIEPIFQKEPYKKLVPQIEIVDAKSNTSISILDAGHRLGDAVIRCTDLADKSDAAFKDFLDNNDASKIAKLAPTSLVFGVWNSRGEPGTQNARFPRLVQSIIRAWGVSELTRSAQYSPPLDYVGLGVFSEEDRKKDEGDNKSPLAKRGYVHVPSVKEHGGVIAKEIRRDVTLNLVALRRLQGENTEALRTYILGLALVSVVAPFDGFLRSGCLLVPDRDSGKHEICHLVHRNGEREPINLSHKDVLDYAEKKADSFGVVTSPQTFKFDKDRAKTDSQKSKKNKKQGK